MAENGNTTPTPTTFYLSATYESPINEPFTHAEHIPAPSSPSSVADKTAYLSSLREAINSAQESINRELTARMEEDKAREASGSNNKKTAVNDALEEENYGEEAAPNDD